MFAMTLYVDPLLGIVMGYCFVLASRSPQRRLSDSVFFALALAVLCLLKSTGIAFAGFALGAAAAIIIVISSAASSGTGIITGT